MATKRPTASDEVARGRHMKSDERLFRKSIEALAIAIRQKETIKGVTIGTEETKVLQFADDTTAAFFLSPFKSNFDWAY